MASLMAPDGLLILDPAEHLGEAASLFGPPKSGAYALRSRMPGSRGHGRGPHPQHEMKAL
jgi:hypothetical protein